jgi:hypothetical protein
MVTAYPIYNFDIRNERKTELERWTPYCTTQNFLYSLHLVMLTCMLLIVALRYALLWLGNQNG